MDEEVVEDLTFLEEEEVLEGLALLLLEESGHDLVEVSAEDGFKAYIVVFTLFRHLKELHQLVHECVVVLGYDNFSYFLFFSLFFILLEVCAAASGIGKLIDRK